MLRTLWTRIVALGLALAMPASATAGPLRDAATRAARELAVAQSDQNTRGRGRLWTSIALIAGGGTLAALGGVGLSDSDTGPDEDMDIDDAPGEDDGDAWKKVMLGGGIAAVGTGVILLFTGGASPSTTISTRPGRVTIRHRIRF